MKKPLPHALPLCFGLSLLALSLSFSTPHPNPSGLPPQNDTTPAATLQQKGGQIILVLYPTLLQGHYTNIMFEWQTLVNGLSGQKGVVLRRNLSATGPTAIVLPLRFPPGTGEVGLQVTGRLAAAPGHKPNTPLFTSYLPLHPWRGDYTMPAAGDLSFTDSNNIFTITSAKTQVQFDKQTGWLLHYEAGGTVLMGDTAGLRTDLGLADTLQPHLQLFFASTGTQIVIVKAEYTLREINCLLHLSYTLNAAGDMLVEQVLETDTTAPAPPEQARSQSAPSPMAPTLPRFGMSWILPKDLDTMSWYAADPPSMPTITPPVGLSREDSCTHVRWLTLKRHDGQGLRISADSNFLQSRIHATNSDSVQSRIHATNSDSVHAGIHATNSDSFHAGIRPADAGAPDPRRWTLGLYKTMYPSTQPRFHYSYRVTPLASTPTITPHTQMVSPHASAIPLHTPAVPPHTPAKKQ